MKSLQKALLAFGFLSALAASGTAGAVPFSITAASFTVDSGYGTGPGQLDATFSTDVFAPQTFDLALGGVKSFLFGTVTLKEENIGFSELNHLGVTANLTFTNPLSAVVKNVAVTGAFVGPVNGNGPFEVIPDFFIDFSPVVVNFDTTGSFTVSLSDLYFSRTGPMTNAATVTLDSLPVPEPGSLALLGLGLFGLGVQRKGKQA